MKKITLSLAIVAAMGLSIAGTANATNNGKLIFNGTLTNISCDINAGTGASPGTNPGDINVDLGNVSFSDIGDFAEANLVTKSPIQLLVNCTGGATAYDAVTMRFLARQGSGLDTADRRLLRTTGAAEGVGIGLVNAADQLMDLSGNDVISAQLVKDQDTATAELNFGAVYVLNGVTTTVAGNADGFLPFVMDYQ